MLFDSGKDMWAALEATFGPSGAGNEFYVMEQFYDYKMTDERSVVQQTHEIQSLTKELEYFKCVLPDKFGCWDHHFQASTFLERFFYFSEKQET